ncbi:MAG: ABC transporter ATP-binding protein [Acidobacteriales bacterium]|nr:ABC transporter ATP-binding protein [Terriglobales bacterium]
MAIQIEKTFGGARGFRVAVAFEAASGVTVLFGPSGAGKTTVLECVAGIQRPDRGHIHLGGKEITSLPPSRRGVGYVFQSPALFPHMTGRENIEYGLHALPTGERRRRAQEAMERFRIAHVAEQRPGRISGGEKQRVALARTLVTEPRALLLDEPLSALDMGTKLGILDDLRAWNRERRVPILYVTHVLHEAFSLGDQVVVMREGRIERQGTPGQALAEERAKLMELMTGR